ncbi:MAG: SMC family ATPase [Bacteroidetes bacterium]|nr:SMC family ATPase [Bacteroidota bacterium]
MIPLKLTIEGLYSYRTRQTIDFTNLTQSGLFGIFGGVGSGKSSILEAISFALYGESERLNSRDKRNYNMMNLKSKKLLIDFEFRSHNDTRYQFVVLGSRNRNKFEDVGAFDRKAARFENGEWIPIPVSDIERITGLNYQNFRRTIIIPQGKFQEFLQLSSGERTTMLKELFNLSKYELSDKIARLDSRNNDTIQHLSGRLQEIGEVDPGKIAVLEKQKVNLQKELGKFKKELEAKEKQDQRAENLKKIAGIYEDQRKKQLKLQQSAAAMQDLDKKTREYELFAMFFKSDLAQLEGLEMSFRTGGEELESGQARLASLQKESEVIRPVYENLRKEYESRDRLLRESEELAKFADVKKTGFELATHTGNAGSLKKQVQETAALVSNGKTRQKDLSLELESLKKSLPDIRIISGVKAWFTELKRLRQAVLDLQKKREERLISLKKLNDEAIASLTRSGLFDIIPGEIDPARFLDRIEQLKSGFEKELTITGTRISELQVLHKLEQYAAELQDGKPCPLCGSEAHPHILNPTDVAGNLESARDAKKEIEARLDRCSRQATSLTASRANRDAILQQQKEFQGELDTLLATEKAHALNFTWAGFDPENEHMLEEEENRFDTIKIQVVVCEQTLKNLGTEIDLNIQLHNRRSEELNRIDLKISAAAGRMELLKQQITTIDTKSYQDFSAEQLLEKSGKLVRQHAALTEKFLQSEKQVTNLSKTITGLTGKIGEMERNHADLLGQLEKLRQKIDKQRGAHGDPELAYVVKVLKQELDVAAERSMIAAYNTSVEVVKKKLEELELELAGQTYDEAAHLVLKEEIKLLKQTIETNIRETGSLEKGINTMKSDAEKFAVLQQELETAELRRQDISELKNLFRGSGFVNYVSTVYLQNLCKAANERFYRLTRQKLGIELAEDNSFEVRDYMNEGHLRSVKTLSGGQTFQASLSLALALADSIHKLAASPENFFFLDEGFGTLDKEALEVAFETLKALRKENRIVGVISHVEEMQAEIETYLKVTNDEEHGSVVTRSWEG